MAGFRTRSLTKQSTFRVATTGFTAKWRLRNERRNFILMKRHYPSLWSASDWLNQISHVAWPIRSTTQIWVVTHHQYGISAIVSRTPFDGEKSDGIAKCTVQARAMRTMETRNWRDGRVSSDEGTRRRWWASASARTRQEGKYFSFVIHCDSFALWCIVVNSDLFIIT